MDRPLGAQISHMLKERGVDVIFGVPGVHNQELYRGIEEAGITHVLARHEQGAGFMADGYARATGRPGVAYVITGPGLCNIMTPVGQAYSDSVPLLVISSCLDETAATRGQLHQMLDQEAAGACVSDWSETARSARAAYGLIDRAMTEFQTSRPRPKHITVPIAVLEARASQPPAQAKTIVGQGVPRSSYVEEVARLLSDAERPIIILGGGLGDAEAGAAVARQVGAASFVTFAGRGLVPLDQPLHFGPLLARPDSIECLASADLILAVGTELSEGDLWRDPLGHTAPMIRVDIDPEVLSDRHRPTHGIQADADAFMAALVQATADATPATGWNADEVAATRDRWRAAIDVERPGIAAVVTALSEALPDDTMIYSDMTQFAYAALELWDMPRPRHWHHPTGFGTLGYALPAAIGGAVSRPGSPTLAIAGDYGFQYTIQELATAVELGLPLPIILWDNGKLGEIEDGMIAAQIAPNAVVQTNPDFIKLAEAYGAKARKPSDLAGLVSDVKAAFDADRPTLIHVAFDIA